MIIIIAILFVYIFSFNQGEKNIINIYDDDLKALNDKIDGFVTKIDDLYSLLMENPQEVEIKGRKNVK